MNKSTNNSDIDKFKVDKKTQIKVVILSIIGCIVCGLMAVYLFGNGEGLPTSFEAEEEVTSIIFAQVTDGESSKATRSTVSFEIGDTFSVYSDGVNGKETLSCEVADGTLTIILNTSKDTLPDFFSSDSSQITVTIPEGTVLESFIIEADLLQVVVDSIDAESFKLVGDQVIMNVFDSTFLSTSLTNDLGNLYFYDTNCGEFTLTGGTTNPQFKYCTFENFDAYIAFGNLLIDDATINEVNLVSDLGYVDITNITLAGNFTAYADYGAVVLSLTGDVEDYIIDAYIMESGKYYLDENLQEGTDSSLQQITIDTYIGDIDVSFVS